jgi:outer membrane biosynthesis protein TonB
MITEADNSQERNDDRTTLVWSLLVSGFVNLMSWMLVAWVVALRMQAIQVAQDRPEETFMVASSSIHIAQHSHPVPHQENPSPVTAQKSQQKQPQKSEKEAATPRPSAAPTEVARIVPNASPQPKPAPKKQNQGSLAEQLAQQQVAFQHEAQQINAHNAPYSIATIDPAQRESATRQYRMNFSGNQELEGKGEGYLIPLQRWIDNGLHCYYGQYYWLYPTGGTEVGNIPWPFCFPPGNDPIARGIRQFPFPLPMRGYQLPAGTYLYPIEKDVYEAWLSQQG